MHSLRDGPHSEPSASRSCRQTARSAVISALRCLWRRPCIVAELPMRRCLMACDHGVLPRYAAGLYSVSPSLSHRLDALPLSQSILYPLFCVLAIARRTLPTPFLSCSIHTTRTGASSQTAPLRHLTGQLDAGQRTKGCRQRINVRTVNHATRLGPLKARRGLGRDGTAKVGTGRVAWYSNKTGPEASYHCYYRCMQAA